MDNEIEIFSGPISSDTFTFFLDLITKHDELAKMLQFPTEPLQWFEESREGDESMTSRIYAWDATGNYHEISIERTDATTDDCRIQFNRTSDDLAINVNWRQEA